MDKSEPSDSNYTAHITSRRGTQSGPVISRSVAKILNSFDLSATVHRPINSKAPLAERLPHVLFVTIRSWSNDVRFPSSSSWEDDASAMRPRRWLAGVFPIPRFRALHHMFHDDTRGVGNREPYGRSLPVCIRAFGPDYCLVRIHDAELAPVSNSGYIGSQFLVLISVTQGRVHDNRSGQGLPGYGGTKSLTHGEVRVATITPRRRVPWSTPSVVFFGAMMTTP